MTRRRAGPPRRRCCDRNYARRDEALCPACAPTRCGGCYGLRGRHAPSCKAGLCHGCGTRTAIGTKFYCPTCQAQQCPECRRFNGQHGPNCRYLGRRRRPPLATMYGVVSEQDIVELYTTAHAKAIRIARYVGDLNRPEAEDVVSECFLYLWRKRDLLKAPPGRAYLFKAVEHGAIRAKTRGWARHVVTMDPEDLVIAEQMTHPARGRRLDTTVRLPEEVPAPA